MRMFDAVKKEFVDTERYASSVGASPKASADYEAMATDKEAAGQNGRDKLCYSLLSDSVVSKNCHPSEIVVVFEPNRPSYELRRIK